MTLFAVALFAAVSTAHAEPRVALVIGNGAYDPSLGALANPVNDAVAMKAVLVRDGFNVDLQTNLDQRAMKQAIVRLGDRLRAAGPGTTGLFYYGGHGLQVGGTNYLVPIGAQISKEEDADIESVAADSVLRQMARAGNAVDIVILDACRNTPVFRGFRDTSRGLAPIEAPQGSFVAYSTAPGETAADGTGANSPFALALVSGLEKPATSIEDMFRDVRRNVLGATAGRQTPWDSSSLVTPFYFLPPGAAGDASRPPQSVPSLKADAAAIEKDVWDSVKDSNDRAQLQSYLDQYPGGAFAAVARAKIQSLAPRPQVAVIAPAQQTAPASDISALSDDQIHNALIGSWTITLDGSGHSVSLPLKITGVTGDKVEGTGDFSGALGSSYYLQEGHVAGHGITLTWNCHFLWGCYSMTLTGELKSPTRMEGQGSSGPTTSIWRAEKSQ